MEYNDQKECRELRQKIFQIGYAGGMAHLASCFSCVEILYTLYRKNILRYKAENIAWSCRDRLILSKGHAGLALYAVLCRVGLLKEEELNTYLQPGCHIGGEPCMRDLKVIEATTGSLGHGLPMGVGMALAQKLDGMDARTYVLLGDGECQEGSVWEAAIAAAAFGLSNLIAVLDCNQIQKMESVQETMQYVHWKEKWQSFGWNVLESDGHDVEALQATFQKAAQQTGPTIVIAHTVKGKGVSLMENDPIWHFKLPNKKELRIFRAELGLTNEAAEQED